MSVKFFSDDVDFMPDAPSGVSQWLIDSAQAENHQIGNLSYIFCSDEALHKMNIQYLEHDTLTDIITFDLSDNQLVKGEFYISIDRVKDNAKDLNIPFEDELHRVLIHGLLHLIGYNDKTPEDQQVMRSKEDNYLNLRSFL